MRRAAALFGPESRENSEVDIAANPIVFEGRKAWLLPATDVTEKRSLEAQLLQSQKMESFPSGPALGLHIARQNFVGFRHGSISQRRQPFYGAGGGPKMPATISVRRASALSWSVQSTETFCLPCLPATPASQTPRGTVPVKSFHSSSRVSAPSTDHSMAEKRGCWSCCCASTRFRSRRKAIFDCRGAAFA